MRILFLGSAGIACPSLETLLRKPGMDIVGVITQPDRPAGRQRRTASCAAKRYATERGARILTPERINDPETVAQIRSWRPDIGVVVAYGQILKRDLLGIPPLGFVNLHTSLLPKYRGAAPIQWAVANGESRTGVTIMKMDEGMDTGDILAQQSLPIGESDHAGDIHDRLAMIGARLLAETLADLEAGRIIPRPQDPGQATRAPKLRKADGALDWRQPSRWLYNRIRGFDPWPGCFCRYPCGRTRQTLRILSAQPVCGRTPLAPPGTVLCVQDGPLIACGEGALRLLKVQPENGRIMEAPAFLCGRALQVGDRLDA